MCIRDSCVYSTSPISASCLTADVTEGIFTLSISAISLTWGKVKKGDVLCVIEAMKLLNEITADTDGEIVDVCVENGQLVEYGQVLFKIF